MIQYKKKIKNGVDDLAPGGSDPEKNSKVIRDDTSPNDTVIF